MARNTDWLPSGRKAQLEMAQNWYKHLIQSGNLWFVPETTITDLNVAINEAQNEDNIPASERNAVTNARLNLKFRDLTTMMRDIKRRYFFVPPLTEYEIVALGLKPKDNIPTSVLDPTGQAEAGFTFPGRTQLMAHIKPVESVHTDPRAYYGCRIYYGVYAADAAPPVDGTELRESLFTRRKKELFNFLPKDSGKTAYFCIRYENSKGKAGPWGPMTWANIP